MKKQPNHTKLKKKEIKSSLIQTIEATLGIMEDEKAFKKVRKSIKAAAKRISNKFFKKLKKENPEQKNNRLPLTHHNKKFTKKLKGKPTKENFKEALKL